MFICVRPTDCWQNAIADKSIKHSKKLEQIENYQLLFPKKKNVKWSFEDYNQKINDNNLPSMQYFSSLLKLLQKHKVRFVFIIKSKKLPSWKLYYECLIFALCSETYLSRKSGLIKDKALETLDVIEALNENELIAKLMRTEGTKEKPVAHFV